MRTHGGAAFPAPPIRGRSRSIRGEEMLVRRFVAAGVAVAMLGPSAPAHGQTQAPADSSAGKPTLFEGRDLYWAAAFAAATVAVAPLDRQLAHTLQRPSLQANRILSRSSVGARLL